MLDANEREKALVILVDSIDCLLTYKWVVVCHSKEILDKFHESSRKFRKREEEGGMGQIKKSISSSNL